MSVYSIKDLEYISGIKAHTIRIWEKRYQLLEPDRSTTNIRSYSDDDVRKILNIAMLVKHGYRISNVACLSSEKLQAEVLRFSQMNGDPERNLDQLMVYAINFEIDEFERYLDALINKDGFAKVMEKYVFPFFGRIGILWQAGSIFAAQEHFVSNLIRKRLICEAEKFDSAPDAKTILFFLRENEWHELGLLYSNYLAAQAGLKCIYLGQSLPVSDLSGLLANKKFDFVCTSFVHAVEKAELENYLANLASFFRKSQILISGRQIALNEPKLPVRVSAVKSAADFVRKISG
jgi:DNA-binding transcriptional MerR regulator